HYIGFDDVGTFDPRTGLLYKVTEPYEGKYKKPMAPVEFYRRIGREDLAQEYTAREIRRNELMTAGAVIGLGSLVASAIIVTNALIQRELRREQSAGIRPVPCRKELTRGLGAPDSQRCRTRRRIARWRAAARRRIDQPKSNRRV